LPLKARLKQKSSFSRCRTSTLSSTWEKDARFGEALVAMKPRMIDVPQLNELAAESVQQRGQPFSSFSTDPANSRILRGYVADWTARVRTELDRVGVGKAVQCLGSWLAKGQ